MELDNIQSKIFDIRNQKVILDVDLAKLYATETRQLKRAVRRNIERFPDDFMFQLTKDECNTLLIIGVCQFGTPQYNFSAYLPFAFTEHGVAMLSSVLRSDIAIKINISIMRAFVTVRNILQKTNTSVMELDSLKKRIEHIELGVEHVNQKIENVEEDVLKITNDLSEDIRTELDDIYLVLNELASTKEKTNKRNPIGFIQHNQITNENE